VPAPKRVVRWGSLSFRMRDVYFYFRLGTAADGRRSVTRAFYVGRLRAFVDGACASPGSCTPVDFGAIDRWLANPHRRFDDHVNLSFEDLVIRLRSEANSIALSLLDREPRL